MTKFHQDARVYEKLKNPGKYVGKVKQVVTRSSWEKIFVKRFLDLNPNVVEWSSEDVVLRYVYELDGRVHRYFVDFWMKVKEQDGTFHEYLVEIKPSNQIFQQQNGKIVCVKPKKPKRRSKSYINRVNDYIKNTNKMAATQDYIKKLQAAGRNIDFRIITEKELGIK